MHTVDAFAFFNELDILEIRLTELYPAVDKFVLVEATRTHQGNPKPLYYAENRHRFTQWNDKVIHVVVGDLPGGDTFAANWRREIGQRQAIARGLADTPDDALVLVSDLDEIPRREIVERLKASDFPDDLIVTFNQLLYYFDINNTNAPPRWLGTRATLAGNVRALTPDGVRWEGLKPRSHEYPRHVIIDGAFIGLPPGTSAGWHLSYFGDAEHVRAKQQAFLHQELLTPENTSPEWVQAQIAAGADVWGRADGPQFMRGPATNLPWALRADPMRFAHLFHTDWQPDFHEDWYSADMAAYVAWVAQHAPPSGAMVEIGCWEGRSTVCIAQTIAPRSLVCVDHWRGNVDEQDAKQEAHPAAAAATDRDVYATFTQNIARLTAGNVAPYRMDWREWIAAWDQPIAFLHLDASHDYQSVYDCLCAVKPFLVPGAIVCGDDLYADGVYRGTRDALGAVQDVGGRLWVWQQTEGL